MSEKLGEKGLVHILKKVFDRYIPNAADDEAQDLAIQAHAQLKEIIEWWYKSGEQIYEMIQERQRVRVSPEFIAKWVEGFGQETGYGYLTPPHTFLRKMLEEIGVIVE